jgi:hypothetical protein
MLNCSANKPGRSIGEPFEAPDEKMAIQIYSTALFVGEIAEEFGELAWIHDDGGHVVGKVEIDWGDENLEDHIASVFKNDKLIVSIVLDRYISNVGQVMRRDKKVGEIRLMSPGNCSVYRGSKLIGNIKTNGKDVSDKHLILFGGGGAALLVGL